MHTHFGAYKDQEPEWVPVPELSAAGRFLARVSRQGQITVINTGPSGRGFRICDWCGWGEPAPASAANDGIPVNLGTRFVAGAAGTVSALRFYKPANETGAHTGYFWTSSGTLLGSASFTPTASGGWQTAALATPISVASGATYVVSYSTTGAYAYTAGGLSAPISSGPLTAPGSTNGVFAYGTAGLFPTASFNATNYFADVVYYRASENRPPVAVADSGFVTTKDKSLVIDLGALLANDSDPDGDVPVVTGVTNAVNGLASLDAATGRITFVPLSGYTGAAGFTYAIADGNGGTASATGLSLSGVDFGLALMSEKVLNAPRRWLSLEASASGAAFVGVDGLTVDVSNAAVSINRASADGKVVDYSAGKTDLSIATSSSTSLKLAMPASAGELLRASAHLALDVFGFVQLAGDFALDKRSSSLTLDNGNAVQVDLLTLGAQGASGFAGMQGGTASAQGLALSDVNLALVMAGAWPAVPPRGTVRTTWLAGSGLPFFRCSYTASSARFRYTCSGT